MYEVTLFPVCNISKEGPWFFNEIPDLTKNNNALFEMKEGELSPYGLIVLVKFTDHFECLLTNSTDGSPFFPVGIDLPDMFYKGCKIDPSFWKSLSVDEISEHNEKVLRDYKTDAGSKDSSLFSFRKFHKKANNIKFKRDFLKKIVFGTDVPWKIPATIQTKEKKIDNAIRDKKYFSDFRASICYCEFSVLPCYLSGRIFQSVFHKENPLSKILEEFDYNQYLLKGKHVQRVSILSKFSHDLKQVFGEDSIDYDKFEDECKEAKPGEEKSKGKRNLDNDKNSEKANRKQKTSQTNSTDNVLSSLDIEDDNTTFQNLHKGTNSVTQTGTNPATQTPVEPGSNPAASESTESESDNEEEFTSEESETEVQSESADDDEDYDPSGEESNVVNNDPIDESANVEDTKLAAEAAKDGKNDLATDSSNDKEDSASTTNESSTSQQSPPEDGNVNQKDSELASQAAKDGKKDSSNAKRDPSSTSNESSTSQQNPASSAASLPPQSPEKTGGKYGQ